MEQTDILDVGCTTVLAQIDRRKRGQWRTTIPDLMQLFGYKAVSRVHQASLERVLELLAEWGVAFQLPGGTSVYDEIVLFRAAPVIQQPTAAPTLPTLSLTSPLYHLFTLDGLHEDARIRLRLLSLHSAIWALRPVCLFVEASDDLFHFICGYGTAMMGRRALMLRDLSVPRSPTILSGERLRQGLGQMDTETMETFPSQGAVYLLRQHPEDFEDDELVQTLRDSFVPHTLTLQERPDVGAQLRGLAEPSGESCLPALLQWFAAFTGHLQAVRPGIQPPMSVAGLLADAVRTRDLLLDRRMLQPSDSALRSGFESTEHIVLKSLVLSYLQTQYPPDQIRVEKVFAPLDADGQHIHNRRDRPDIQVGNELWIELETLRSLSLYGSNPFFALEAKLRQKLDNLASVNTVWLLVPSDVAALATEQVTAIARNLNQALKTTTVRCGFVDGLTGEPIFLEEGRAPLAEPMRISGVLLRREPPVSQLLTWDDIAGYQDIKQRLHEDILDPLVHRQRYASFGIVAANGVLLYGLPGCGKSLIGHVIAGQANLPCRLLKPSDMTSMWLGEGVMKIRAVFDWAMAHAPCVLVLDELDAVAPQRREHNMHTDEKRQVNELLAQLSRIADHGVIVVGTTNYVRGIDVALQRSGRFDLKLPIFPPDETDRAAIFHYYLTAPRLKGFAADAQIDVAQLAQASPLYTPADIKALVHSAARASIRQATEIQAPLLTTSDLLATMRSWPRSIRYDVAQQWIEEAELELGNDPHLQWLREEVARAYA